MLDEYKSTINELHKLAKSINYNVENLDSQKICFTKIEDNVRRS